MTNMDIYNKAIEDVLNKIESVAYDAGREAGRAELQSQIDTLTTKNYELLSQVTNLGVEIVALNKTIDDLRKQLETTPTPPAPVTNKVAYGWNPGGWWKTGGESAQPAFERAVAAFGKPKVMRLWPNKISATWKGDLVPSYIYDSGCDLFVNTGGNIAAANSGSLDASFTAMVKAAPTDREVWISFAHEPENDGFVIADWQKAQMRLAAIVKKVGGANVHFAPLLMGSTFLARYKESSPTPASGWFDFDLSNCDGIGSDIYQHGKTDATADTALDIVKDCIDFARARGKKLIVGELGSRNLLSDDARAKFLKESVDMFNANADTVVSVMYFENDNGSLGPWNLLPKPGTNSPSLPKSIAVWRSAVSS